MHNRCILWHRRDIRLRDNTALNKALEHAKEIIPLFIFDDDILNKRSDFSPACVRFMLESLEALEQRYHEKGAKLVFRRGKPLDVLQSLQKETGATAIFFNEDYESYAKIRDHEVTAYFQNRGVEVRACFDTLALHPALIKTQKDEPYTVFSPFKKNWLTQKEHIPVPSPEPQIVKTSQWPGLPLPKPEALSSASDVKPEVTGGIQAAETQWQMFKADGMKYYKARRDFPAIEGTSRLSAHLRFGTISIRQLFFEAFEELGQANKDSVKNIEGFISELIWREFYFNILYHFPHVEHGCFKQDLDGIAWENNEVFFEAWKNGQTGYPIVDAAMRQLVQTGWMHNRLRMIVASFLCKDLLIDWRWGELFFMQHLVDGDLAQNNSGWQWAASTGTDAQPYFRIFNPTLQSIKFDPDGTFIRRFVPELSDIPVPHIHEPYALQKKSPLSLEESGIILGKSYPFPIVEHKIQREKALKLYKL